MIDHEQTSPDGIQRDVWGRPVRREPEAVGSFLDALLAKVTTPGGSVMVRLAGEWDQLAGREWAGRSTPVKLAQGTLTVEVADGATASLLRFQVAALQQNLNRRFGPDTVQGVSLRVRRSSSGR